MWLLGTSHPGDLEAVLSPMRQEALVYYCSRSPTFDRAGVYLLKENKH